MTNLVLPLEWKRRTGEYANEICSHCNWPEKNRFYYDFVICVVLILFLDRLRTKSESKHILFLWILVERLTWSWALSASQWQLYRHRPCVCTLVVCDPFKYPPKWLQRILLVGRCHVKLLPPRCRYCVHHTNMYQFTVSLYSKKHT